MIRRSSQVIRAWFLVCDLALTALAWLGAWFLRFRSGWLPVEKEPLDLALCLENLPLVLLLAAVAFHFTGQYAIDRLRRLREEAFAVLKGGSLLALLVMATTFYRQDPYRSRVTLTLFFVLSVACVLAGRIEASLGYLSRSG